jgi:hypothetical protein
MSVAPTKAVVTGAVCWPATGTLAKTRATKTDTEPSKERPLRSCMRSLLDR